NRIVVARPFPIPSPGLWPAPMMTAILPSRRMSSLRCHHKVTISPSRFSDKLDRLESTSTLRDDQRIHKILSITASNLDYSLDSVRFACDAPAWPGAASCPAGAQQLALGTWHTEC